MLVVGQFSLKAFVNCCPGQIFVESGGSPTMCWLIRIVRCFMYVLNSHTSYLPLCTDVIGFVLLFSVLSYSIPLAVFI